MAKDFQHDDTKNWKLGIFYFNKKDHRFIVRKKNKMMGWTFNFAHPISFIVLIAILLIAVIPVFIGL